MDAVEYLKTVIKMCDSMACGSCKNQKSCEEVKENPEAFVEAVEKWKTEQSKETCEKSVYDPVELVKDLADKIGIHQLYAIARDIRGEGVDADRADLIRQNEELKAHIQFLKEDKAMMQGEINGLRFAIRCNGVSGNEVQ